VVATGTPILGYQWQKDGANVYDGGNISGTRTATLTLGNVTSTDAGNYSVRVTNGYGTATSAAVALSVSVVTVSATSSPIVGGSVTLAVNDLTASSYQWRYRGTPIAGATNATLTLSNLSRGQNGDYDVVLTHSGGTTVAQAYTLDVCPAVMPDLYQADATFAPRFEQEGAGSILAVVRLPDGKFLVGGDFTKLGNTQCLYLARLNADGSLDASYTPPVLTGTVRALVAQADGKVWVGGDFAFVDRQRSGGLVRLNADLTVDPAFAVGQGFDASVRALAAQSDGKVVVGGDFQRYGASNAPRLVRLNADASIDSTLSYANSIGPVRVLQVQSDGKVLAPLRMATLHACCRAAEPTGPGARMVRESAPTRGRSTLSSDRRMEAGSSAVVRPTTAASCSV
jgi:uncharacterized delta-60 repeat protein